MRIRLIVEMNTDPVPGPFHAPKDCAERVDALLRQQLPSGYQPHVRLHPVSVHDERIENIDAFLEAFFGPRPQMMPNGKPECYIRGIKALYETTIGRQIGLKACKERVDDFFDLPSY